MNINSAGLPMLKNYQEAVAHYESIVPYRSGSERGMRPLGRNRRYKYCQIIRTDDAVKLTLIDADLVTFYEDGTIAIWLGKWNSVTTRQFIHATTPFDVVYDKGSTYLGVGGKWYAFDNAATHIFIEPDGKVRNPTQQYSYRIDKKAMKSKREAFRPFLNYVSDMGKLMVGIDPKEIAEVALRNKSTFAEFNIVDGQCRLRPLHLPVTHHLRENTNLLSYLEKYLTKVEDAQRDNNLESIYDYFVLLGISSLTYNHYLEAFCVSYYRNEERVVAPSMMDYFDEIIKYVHGKEIFKRIEVPIGTKMSNENRKYFLTD